MKSIPTRFLRDACLLLNVPQSEFLETPICEKPLEEESRLDFFRFLRKPDHKIKANNPKQKTTRAFKTAAWLSFRTPPEKPVTLLLSYKDAKGEFSIIIDETTPDGSHSLMLSGDIEITFYGELEYLKAIATGIQKEHGLFIEEIYVRQIRNTKNEKKNKQNYWLVSGEK
jgi:hypothetical protein